MPTYVVVNMTQKNQDAMTTYSQAALPTVKKHGGSFLTKGQIHSLHGDKPFKAAAIIEFPSDEDAMNWYESEEYQTLLPKREEAMNSQFSLIQC